MSEFNPELVTHARNALQDLAKSGYDLNKLLSDIEPEDDLTRRTFAVQIKSDSIDLENRTCEFVFSTEALDSHGEIVRQDWDGDGRLERYKANPVVLYHHNRASWFDRAEDTLPIGTCVEIGVKKKQLSGKLRFVDEKANPMAEKVWQGIIQGSLRATSVGFRPHNIQYEVIDDDEQLVLSKNELYEISIVPMGSNPEAVALSAGQTKQCEEFRRIAKTIKEKDMAKEDDKNKDAETRYNHAEAARLEAENRLAEREKELAEREAALAERDAEVEKLRGQTQAAQAREIAAEASAFIGRKIAPAQKDLFIKLRAGDGTPEDFKSFVESLPDMPHVKSVVKSEGTGSPKQVGGSALAKAANDAYEAKLKEGK